MMMSKLADLKARLEFWYVKKFCKLDKHWTFFLDLNQDSNKSFAVKILKKYPDTIVEFANIEMKDDGELSFDFDVIANPKLHDTESKGFKKFTTNIMRSMILHSLESLEKEVNENRNIDLVKSNTQRTVHEESVAISEERVPERKPRKKAVRRNKKVYPEVQHSATESSIGDQS
jgi:hypothetical protein